MGDHVDAFCPACGAKIGPGTLDIIGCPLCGYTPTNDDDGEETPDEG
jgi:Zn finger protein HypA/HybF involved in hydrogenase expression